MNGGMIFFIVVLCLWALILLLSIVVTPLRIFWKVLKYAFVLVVEILYLAFVWWWISLIRICFGKTPLKVVLFQKGN